MATRKEGTLRNERKKWCKGRTGKDALDKRDFKEEMCRWMTARERSKRAWKAKMLGEIRVSLPRMRICGGKEGRGKDGVHEIGDLQIFFSLSRQWYT